MDRTTLQDRLSEIQHMNVGELREEWRRLFYTEPRSYNRDWLRKRLAWAIQAREFGGLSELTNRRIARLIPLAQAWMPLGRGPLAHQAEASVVQDKPPTTFRRVYRRRAIVVTKVEDGFECEGKVYRSLSSVAKAVTGSHTSGPRFFGIHS